MSIGKRITQLLRADVHGVLDLLEEPEAMARQSVREMEQNILSREQQLQSLGDRLAKKVQLKARYESRALELQKKVELCIEEQNHDTAKSLIRRTLENRQYTASLTAQIKQIEEDKEKQAALLDEHKQRLERIKEKLEICSGSKDPAAAEGDSQFAEWCPNIGEDEVQAAFLEAVKNHQSSSKKGE